MIDTAMAYGNGVSENFLGKALREIGVKRSEVVISTKIPGQFLNPDDIFRSVDKSLRIMGSTTLTYFWCTGPRTGTTALHAVTRGLWGGLLSWVRLGFLVSVAFR